jgi:hypothetical protein
LQLARGWESKSVEMQIEERDKRPAPPENTPDDSAARRELEVLELSRKRLLHELESVGDMGDHRFRALKRRALAHVEAAIVAVTEKAALAPKQTPPR